MLVEVLVEEFDSEEMIEELVRRGYVNPEGTKDAIYELYRDYLQHGLDGEFFEKKLKRFFFETINKVAL